jgi:hypothetical protein
MLMKIVVDLVLLGVAGVVVDLVRSLICLAIADQRYGRMYLPGLLEELEAKLTHIHASVGRSRRAKCRKASFFAGVSSRFLKRRGEGVAADLFTVLGYALQVLGAGEDAAENELIIMGAIRRVKDCPSQASIVAAVRMLLEIPGILVTWDERSRRELERRLQSFAAGD